jgi:hypothetical protein
MQKMSKAFAGEGRSRQLHTCIRFQTTRPALGCRLLSGYRLSGIVFAYSSVTTFSGPLFDAVAPARPYRASHCPTPEIFTMTRISFASVKWIVFAVTLLVFASNANAFGHHRRRGGGCCGGGGYSGGGYGGDYVNYGQPSLYQDSGKAMVQAPQKSMDQPPSKSPIQTPVQAPSKSMGQSPVQSPVQAPGKSMDQGPGGNTGRQRYSNEPGPSQPPAP